MKTTMLVFAGALSIAAVARAQDPPLPPAQPPATPVTQEPVTAPLPATAPAVRVTLNEAEIRSRRDAMFLMEGVLERAIELAALSTQREIESMQPGVRAILFSPVKPAAYGTYLEDYGVFFQVQIPSYVPSVVSIVRDLQEAARNRPDPAQPTALAAPVSASRAFDPDALYVDAVRRYLTDAMLKQSRSLDIRPHEWLTVSARGEEGELGGPAIMVLRVKGSDLDDFLAGRLSSDQVMKRVQITGFSSRR